MPNNDIGFSDGTGTVDNPLSTGEVYLTNKKSGGFWNTFDKVVNGLSSLGNTAANLVTATKTGEKSSLGSGVNQFVKDSLDGVSVQTGLDKGTKIFLAVLAVAGLGAWYYQKKR